MDKNAIFNHYSRILDTAIEKSAFFKAYLQYSFTMNYVFTSEDDGSLPESVGMGVGCTRACLVDSNYDYVVKFDLTEVGSGDCAREERLYYYAQQENVDSFFIPCYYVGTYTKTYSFYTIEEMSHIEWYYDELDCLYDGLKNMTIAPHDITISIPLYAYPRANEFDFFTPENEQTSDIVRNSRSPLKKQIEVANEFVRRYGVESYNKFNAFCEKWNINDLHSSNVMELNGELKIADYAGYPGVM